MNRISWSEAFRAMIRPSLIVGPLLGGIPMFLGGIVVHLVMSAGEPSDSASIDSWLIPLLLMGVIGLLLGLLIATPFCLTFGALALRTGSNFRAMQSVYGWIFFGLLGGAIGSFVISALYQEGMQPAGDIAFLTIPLGLIGALFCRWMLRGIIATFSQSR